MNRYSKGVIYLLTIPENPADLYNLPEGAVTQIKRYLLQDFPVQIDSPALVSLFAYDNNTFVIESFRPVRSAVNIALPGAEVKLRDLASGKLIVGHLPPPPPMDRRGRRRREEPARMIFPVQIEPQSYRAYRIEH